MTTNGERIMREMELRIWAVEATLKSMGGIHRPAEEIIRAAAQLEEYAKCGTSPKPDDPVKLTVAA
jgi:hypothetical protein